MGKHKRNMGKRGQKMVIHIISELSPRLSTWFYTAFSTGLPRVLSGYPPALLTLQTIFIYKLGVVVIH